MLNENTDGVICGAALEEQQVVFKWSCRPVDPSFVQLTTPETKSAWFEWRRSDRSTIAAQLPEWFAAQVGALVVEKATMFIEQMIPLGFTKDTQHDRIYLVYKRLDPVNDRKPSIAVRVWWTQNLGCTAA